MSGNTAFEEWWKCFGEMLSEEENYESEYERAKTVALLAWEYLENIGASKQSGTQSIDVPQAPVNMVLLKKGWIVYRDRDDKIMTYPFKDGHMPTIFKDEARADGHIEFAEMDDAKAWKKKAELWVEA